MPQPSGSVQTSNVNRLAINAADFNTLGTDAWPAVKAALQYLNDTGGKLIFPAGTYNCTVTERFELSRDNIEIDASAAKFVFEVSNHDGASSRIFTLSGNHQKVSLGSIEVVENGSLIIASDSVQRTIEIEGDYCSLAVEKLEGAMRHIFVTGDYNNVTVKESIVNNLTRGHLSLTGSNNIITVLHGHGTANDGIVNNGGNYNTIQFSEIEGVDEICFDDIGGTGNKWLYNYAHDNTTAQPLMRIGQTGYGCKDFLCVGNKLVNSLGAGLSITGQNQAAGVISTDQYTGIVRDLQVDGCSNAVAIVKALVLLEDFTIKNTTNGAVRLRDGSSFSRVRNGVIIGSASNGVEVVTTSPTIVENGISTEDVICIDCANAGIYLENSRNHKIKRNGIYCSTANGTAVGIELNANSQGVTMDDNVISNNVTTPIVDNSATKATFGNNFDEDGVNRTKKQGSTNIGDGQTTANVVMSLWSAPRFIHLSSADPAQSIGWNTGTLALDNLDILRSGSSGSLSVHYQVSI